MDKILRTTEEVGVMHVVLKDGTTIPVKAKTIYTHWESGRKDCAVKIEEPLTTIAKQE